VPEIVEVAFKGNRKEFFLWDLEEAPPLKAAVIVDADRGEDLGRLHAVGDSAAVRMAGVPHGHDESPEKRVRRLATAADISREIELRSEEDDARRRAIERVRAAALVMKVTDAEWQWDRKKLTFYFTADKRVDFRALVRELATHFRTRIELKQIGVRDEARRLDGVGRCGRQYCSASWLPELRPVNLGVAKDQRLSLNPSQISGACGRLMCSLRYEHEFYAQSRKRFPKEGRIVRTARGEEKVLANDIFRERVTLRDAEGETRIIPLADFRAEVDALSPAPVEHTAEPRGQSADDTATETRRAERRRRAPEAQPAPAAPTVEVASAGDHIEGEQGESAVKRGRRRGRRGGRRNRGGSKPSDDQQNGTGDP
jgi:cell fate regulator YaaT (PSP1 superfamily)